VSGIGLGAGVGQRFFNGRAQFIGQLMLASLCLAPVLAVAYTALMGQVGRAIANEVSPLTLQMYELRTSREVLTLKLGLPRSHRALDRFHSDGAAILPLEITGL
jgi:hypothetical protein